MLALGATLLAAFDWRPAVWIELAGMAALIVIGVLIWVGAISLADYDGGESSD